MQKQEREIVKQLFTAPKSIQAPTRPHLLPGGPKAADGSVTCRPRGRLSAGGSNDRAASARCAALKYSV